jgi:uncharacterized protein Veg
MVTSPKLPENGGCKMHVNDIKNSLATQYGCQITITKTFSRNLTMTYRGIVDKLYPTVFTVDLDLEKKLSSPYLLSYSYRDILLGNIEVEFG